MNNNGYQHRSGRQRFKEAPGPLISSTSQAGWEWKPVSREPRYKAKRCDGPGLLRAPWVHSERGSGQTVARENISREISERTCVIQVKKEVRGALGEGDCQSRLERVTKCPRRAERSSMSKSQDADADFWERRSDLEFSHIFCTLSCSFGWTNPLGISRTNALLFRSWVLSWVSVWSLRVYSAIPSYWASSSQLWAVQKWSP